MMRARGKMVIVTALLLALVAWRHPSADIQVLTHRADDLNPRRVQAALDLGVIAVTLLVTWDGIASTR